MPTPDIERREPVLFAAGDTLLFQKHLAEFPRSQGWSLEYILYDVKGQPTGIVLNSGAPPDGSDDHLIESDNFAANLERDEYILAGYANNAASAPDGGAERHQIYRGELQLTDNLPAGATLEDQRTFAEKMIGHLEHKLHRLESYDLTETDVQRTRFIVEDKNKTWERYWRLLEYRRWELKAQAMTNTGRDPNRIIPVTTGAGW